MTTRWCWVAAFGLSIVTGSFTPSNMVAQNVPDDILRQIQDSQLRLEEIREERATLQREMSSLRVQVEDVSGELENIGQQISASRSVVAEIDFQVEAMAAQVDNTTADLLSTRDELRERQAILHQRLREIYKRGPLHTTQVLLGADSFSDLLNRYHYLRLIASYDRALVSNVRRLEDELTMQTRELDASLGELSRLRDSKIGEVAELRQVETRHEQTLEEFRSQEEVTRTRLDELNADETRLASLVTGLEQRRIEEERRQAMAGAPAGPGGSLSTADVGLLEWPVDGPVLYSFGIQRRPNGAVLRWNGIGIAASVGTPVRAVRAGTVALAGPFEGYGPSVIVSHGDGFYTLYLYLDAVGVVEGDPVDQGQVVGTVGGAGTPEGPRVEFQVRVPIDGSSPQAMDPMRWLRPRAGTP